MMANKVKVIMLEKTYQCYHVEAESLEEAVDKLMDGLDNEGKPIEDGIERTWKDIEETEFMDENYLEI